MFVLAKDGTPLDPCHPARARKLLASGRAVVVRHTPLVIRLKRRTADESRVRGVEIGIDPGSKHTGLAVFRDDAGTRTGLFALRLDHRGSRIRDKLTARARYRRRRRAANLRYRPPRFNNRTRSEGWLAPSLRHRVETTVSWVERLSRWAPVQTLHVERVAFDTHALSAGRPLEGIEYQRGTLCGFEVREYLLAKWGRRCAYCGTTGVPVNIDHIHPRGRGGSDRITNLTLACVPCNQAKGAQPVEEFLARRPKVLAQIQARAEAPLRDAAAVNTTRRALWRALEATGRPVRAASGGRTKWNRGRTGAPKSHTLDALHVGHLDTVAAWPGQILTAAATGRGVYSRTRIDRFGFPRLRLPHVKRVHGYATGDLVRADVPVGKHSGTHIGRVAVRATGSFNITTAHGVRQGIHHRHIRLLQRADGYGYTRTKETTMHVPGPGEAPFPPGPEGPGLPGELR
ncbi:RNA-guided endonuclease IscB [Actinomadura sp. WAC 06369]|uniref:RNA-guided endonuclease IscB n=1 Tax=Actinomadura sp. WAC 06369 TaxID=2203193 RepID=UPI000F7B3B9A|nr:RNA-guided endonuclease IscB [Actinomadura sp. WAC 06369]RSN51945.1 HNH endonuclease [Actinomadura sp. WAC 06369]